MKNKNIFKNHINKIGYIFILFSYSICFSQPLFEKTYQVNNGGLMGGWGLVTNDYLVWSGSSLPDEDGIMVTPNSIWYGALIVTNGSGDTLWTKVNFDSVYKTTYGPVVDNLDGTFWVVGDKVDQNNQFYEYFIEQYDFSSSQYINRYGFQDSIPFNCQKLIKLTSSELLLGGYYNDISGIARAYSMVINTSGNAVWELELPSFSNTVNQVINLDELSNNMSVSVLYLDGSYNTQLVNLLIDTSGQVIQMDTFPSLPIFEYSIGGVYLINVGYKMVIGGYFPNPTFYDIGLFMMDMSSINFIASDTILEIKNESIKSAEKLDSLNGILSGETSSPSNGAQYDAYSILIDSGGNSTNTFHFGDAQYADVFYFSKNLGNTIVSFGNSIRNTPNGLRNLAYIVRYDSLGNVSTGNVESLKEQAVQVYPNPAKDHFKILTSKEQSNTKFHYSLLNQQGKVLVSDSFINETQVSISEYSGQQLCLLIVQGENYFRTFKIVIE